MSRGSAFPTRLHVRPAKKVRVPQSQAAAHPRHEMEEETDKTK